MIPYIDDHCHIDYYPDWMEKVAKARSAGVKIIVNNGLDKETNRKTLEMAKAFPEVKAALGLYPDYALKMADAEIEEEISFIRKNSRSIAAIGEVGLDFAVHDDKPDIQKDRQIEIFRKLIRLAKELDKPLLVHSRKAEKECIDVLEEEGIKKVIMHCFSGNFKLLERIKKKGWYVSIPTNITYSQHFQKMAEEMPISNIFLETDSPYLHPDREVREPVNEPAKVVEGYKKLAELKKMDLEEVKNLIFLNWQRIF